MRKEELVSNNKATVDGTNIEIAKECYQQRSAIIITNTSPAGQVINISIGEEAVIGEGIQLAVGGVYQDTRDGQYLPSNKQINAISSAAGGTVAIQERILMDSY